MSCGIISRFESFMPRKGIDSKYLNEALKKWAGIFMGPGSKEKLSGEELNEDIIFFDDNGSVGFEKGDDLESHWHCDLHLAKFIGRYIETGTSCDLDFDEYAYRLSSDGVYFGEKKMVFGDKPVEFYKNLKEQMADSLI